MDTLQIINLMGISMVLASFITYSAILIYELWNEKEVDILEKISNSIF